MMDGHREIAYRELEGGETGLCRALCDALMAHQADCAAVHPQALRAMSFLPPAPGFEQVNEKQLLVAFGGDEPVGYVFSTADWKTEVSKAERPEWALGLSGVGETGFYPDGLPMPKK